MQLREDRTADGSAGMRQPLERCVATIKPRQQSDDITRMGSGLRKLRTCLSAEKQFDTVLEIWAVIVRLEWR